MGTFYDIAADMIDGFKYKKKWIRNITIIMIMFEGEKPQKSLKWIILFSLKTNEPSNLQTNKKSSFIEINNVNYICLGLGH